MRKEIEFDCYMLDSVMGVLKEHKQFISDICERYDINLENYEPDGFGDDNEDIIDRIFKYYEEYMDDSMGFVTEVVDGLRDLSRKASVEAERIYSEIKSEMEKFDEVDNFVDFYWDEEFYVNQK